MKVLFASDGSPQDQEARRLVAGTRWPAGSHIEIFGVMRQPAIGGPAAERDFHDLERELDYLAAGLPRRDALVTWRCAVGHPAETIAARARALEADLIVVGSRGRGPLATSILGSVSAGVIDRAPCPVLVARTASVHRILLADDGSAGAATAAALLDEWPIFLDALVQVLTVVDVGRPLAAPDDALVLHASAERHYVDSLDAARERAHHTVAARVGGLLHRARPIASDVREGDAADQILAAAHSFAADLIVVGSRGQTGLARFFAGSVARRVLLGATCSVLVARGSAQLVGDPDRETWLRVPARMMLA